jgi:hypothetical protein
MKHRQIDGEGHGLQRMNGIKQQLHSTGADCLARCVLNRRMVVADKRGLRPVAGW